MYDEHMNYIGSGPNGYKELLSVISAVAKDIQEKNLLKKKYHKYIPIIIQDDYVLHYTVEATKEANVHGEASDYLEYVKPYT